MKRTPLKKRSTKQAQKERIWSKIKKKKLKEVGFMCEKCGKHVNSVPLWAHHTVSRSKGGVYTSDNCQILCSQCHEQITNGMSNKT